MLLCFFDFIIVNKKMKKLSPLVVVGTGGTVLGRAAFLLMRRIIVGERNEQWPWLLVFL